MSFRNDGYDGYYDDYGGFRGREEGTYRYDYDYMDDEYPDNEYIDNDYIDDEYAAEEAYGYREEPERRRTNSRRRERDSAEYDGGRRTRTEAGDGRGTGRADSRDRSARTRTGGKGSGGRRRRKRGVSPVLMIVLLIVILAAAFGAKLYLDRYSYSTETADLAEQFGITGESDVAIVWDGQLSEIRARLIDGVYYMTLEDVKNCLNDRFYYGVSDASDETGMIIYCLPTEKITAVIGASEVTGDEGGTTALGYVPAVRVDGTVYLALEFVRQYTAFEMEAFQDPNRLQITTQWEEQTTAVIRRKTQVRTSGGIKSPILEQLEKGDQVIVLEQMDTWSKVMTADAVIGYVENKRLSDIQTQTPSPDGIYEEPEYSHITFEGKINMAFHNVWGSQGNSTLSSYMEQTQDVNIVAPTWYWVCDDDGNLEKAATQDYVDTAHSLGCQVWAVVDNINSSALEDNHTFLTTLASRTNLISQLVEEAQTYGFEGINVDFELIPSENGEDYIEFIRELSIACRKAGIILSVDNYPAYSYNSYYDLEEQGVFVDYVVIMGYDEHYAGSDEAGSVASITYVTEGIQMALEVVDADRIINAIPFYSRIWKTSDGTVSSEAYGMQDIEDYIAAHGMTKSWSSSAGQYYAETTENDVLIQIWVEDAESIRQKLDVMQTFGIKGVAEWRLQFETADVWDVISEYMSQ